jgi:hypothetical protein
MLANNRTQRPAPRAGSLRRPSSPVRGGEGGCWVAGKTTTQHTPLCRSTAVPTAPTLLGGGSCGSEEARSPSFAFETSASCSTEGRHRRGQGWIQGRSNLKCRAQTGGTTHLGLLSVVAVDRPLVLALVQPRCPGHRAVHGHPRCGDQRVWNGGEGVHWLWRNGPGALSLSNYSAAAHLATRCSAPTPCSPAAGWARLLLRRRSWSAASWVAARAAARPLSRPLLTRAFDRAPRRALGRRGCLPVLLEALGTLS